MSTINEFKAWLEGYEESFSSYHPYPDAEQWEKIKRKIQEINEFSRYYCPPWGINSPSLDTPTTHSPPNPNPYTTCQQSHGAVAGSPMTSASDFI